MFQAKEKWKDLLFLQNKIRTYHIFKESYKCKNYLLLNLPFNYISVQSQLRSAILPLHVETGRYVNKPVEERLYKFCDTGDVENILSLLSCIFETKINILILCYLNLC